jgi:hypothetical protein
MSACGGEAERCSDSSHYSGVLEMGGVRRAHRGMSCHSQSQSQSRLSLPFPFHSRSTPVLSQARQVHLRAVHLAASFLESGALSESDLAPLKDIPSPRGTDTAQAIVECATLLRKNG